MLADRTEGDVRLDDDLGVVGDGVSERRVEQSVLRLDGVEIDSGGHTAAHWLHCLLEISLESFFQVTEITF